MNRWTDRQGTYTANGNWDLGQKGPQEAGRGAYRAVKPDAGLPFPKTSEVPSHGLQKLTVLQHGQSTTERRCLEVRAPPHMPGSLGCTDGCTAVFSAHACPSVSSLGEEVTPSETLSDV